MSSTASSAAVEFALLLGEALHRYGTPAHRLEDMLTRVCERLGLEAHFVATPTALFATFGPTSALQSAFVRAESGEMDLERLARLDRVAEDVLHGNITAVIGALEVGRILAAPARYGPWITVVSYGLAAGAAARLFGGGWREIAVAAFSSFIIGLLGALAGHVRAVSRVFDALAAVIASALAALAAVYLGPLSVKTATLAGLVVLLPGLSLTVAMNELATRHLISGTSRLMGTVVVFLKLGFGVALGGRLAALLPPAVVGPIIAALPDWTEPAAVFLLAVAVCVLLKARPRDFVPIALAGALGYVSARAGSRAFGIELGAFCGALVLGVASNLLARLRNGPAVVTVSPGLILIVPGSVGFRSLDSLLQRDVIAGVGTGFSMVMTAVGLVAGLLFANAIVPSRRVL